MNMIFSPNQREELVKKILIEIEKLELLFASFWQRMKQIYFLSRIIFNSYLNIVDW